MASQIIVYLLVFAATYAFLHARVRATQDPKEPKPITGPIPFVSPLIGLIREKEGYYLRIRQEPISPTQLFC